MSYSDVRYWKIAKEIEGERLRQEQLYREGFHAKTIQMCSQLERLAILTEEIGEVAHEVCDGINRPLDKAHLREELKQCAAVCAAWIEALDKEQA
jgi:NTP pyrophosphatase (non-canonical NTP hydrolase)